MATTYSRQAQLALNSTPARKVSVADWHGELRRYSAEITLAAQGSGDDIVLFRVPKGSTFAYGTLNSDTSLGTSTVAIGITGTTAKYKAAATFTTPLNSPVLFGVNAPVGLDGGIATDFEDILLTIGVAALPGSGRLVVDMYFTNS